MILTIFIEWYDGWKLNLGYIEFGKDQMDYESAKTYCEGHGNGLVEIFNQEQMDFVGMISNKMSILTIFVHKH